MKKLFFLFVIASVLSSCTTKEQDQQIRTFWGQQFLQVLSKFMPGQALPLAAAPEASAETNTQDIQEFEEMMKEWEQTQDQTQDQTSSETTFTETQENSQEAAPGPEYAPAANPPSQPAKPVAQVPAKTGTSAKSTSSAKTPKQLNAYLVVSSQCGWCKKLKQEGWPEQFRDKYRGQVRLIEYDVTTSQGQAGYTKLMQRYKMSSVGTPSLFIGDSVVRGYPLADADEAVEKALAKYGKKAARPSSAQFMEITMEDPSGAIKGKAPLKDRKAMQQALDKVLQENQTALQDIGQMFGASTQAEAFAITTKTEKALRQKATQSTSLQEYMQAQRQLLKQQEQSLNKLMQANTQFLRNIH